MLTEQPIDRNGMRTNDRGRSIRIGIQDHCPPISFVDNHGERTGLCVEIARDFVDRVSAEVQLCVLPWKGLVDALAARQIDVIASDLTPRDPAPTGLAIHISVLFWRGGDLYAI